MIVRHYRTLATLCGCFVASFIAVCAQAAPAVRVTLQLDKDRLKVGETATAHVFAQIVPDQLENTTQIFSWYVDLLNSNPAAIQIQPGTVVVPASDSHPNTSSKGTLSGNLRGVYDTFANNPTAGHDAPVELFSVIVKAVAVGDARFSVAPGTGAAALQEDFIVATVSGDPIFGGLYDTAAAQISSFNNLPPTIDPIANVSVNETTQLTVTAVGRDPEAGQTLTYALVGTPPAGAVLNAGTGTLSWTPTEAQGPGVYIFRIKVSDNGTPSMSATNEFTVTVNEVNIAPTVQPVPPRTRSELSLITLQVIASDADVLLGQNPNTNRLSYSLINPPDGAVIDANTGAFSWTPSESQGPGTFNLTAQVTDDGSPPRASTTTFSITVVESNARPLITAPANQSIAEGATLNVAFVTTDVDLPANQLTYTLLEGPPGVVLAPATGLITWTPGEAQGPSTNTIRVSVSDNSPVPLSATNSFQVIVLEVNSPPVLNSLSDRTVTEKTPLSFPAPSSDSDLPGQTLTYSLDGAPPGAAISPTGVFIWTPTEAQGPGRYNIGVRVTDNGSPPRSDTKSFEVVVNEQNTAPALVTPAGQETQTIPELVAKTIQFSSTDGDIPANAIAFSLQNSPPGASIDGASGLFSWTPSETQGPGVYTIRVVATDNASVPLSTTNTITLTVSEANSPPAIDPIANQIVDELNSLTFAVAARDTDVPAQTLTYTLENAPAGASIDAVSGVFNWTPTEAQGPGQYAITVRVRESGAAALSTTRVFSVSVNEVNTRPVVSLPSVVTRSEMAPLSVAATATDSDVLNGQNPPTNRFRFLLHNAPEGAAINEQTGVVSWTPTEAQGPGTYDMRVIATDNGIPPLSGEGTLRISIVEGNRTPSIVAPPSQTIAELSPLNATFTASDPDLPANTLSFSLASGPAGVTVDPATGAVTWTPTEAQGPGAYTIAVMVSDNGSPALRSTNTMNVTVTEVNSKPVLTPIPDYSLTVGDTISFTAVATDPDIPIQAITYSLDSAPQGAAINPTTGVFSWIPTAGQGGQQFTIVIRATEAGTAALFDTKNFKIAVTTQPNTAPVIASPGNQTITAGSKLTVANLAIDTDTPANILTYSLVTAPSGATIDAATGVLTWTPGLTQVGQNQIRVKVADNGVPPLSSTNSFLVSVTAPPNTAPVILNPPNQVATVGVPLNVTNIASDVDLPANTLTFAIVAAPNGVTVNPTTGVLSWTPTVAQVGQSQIQVKVTDNGVPPLSNTNSFFVTVSAPVNTAPIIVSPSSQTVAVGAQLTVTNTATDIDVPPNTLTFAIVAAPSGVSINPATGVLTWTPTAAQVGESQIQVKVTDNGIPPLSNTNSFLVTVTSGNTTPATLRLVSVAVAGTTLRIEGPAGSSYELEYSTDLINWTALTTVSLGAQTFATYLDAAHGFGQQKGFYRAKSAGGTVVPSAPTVGVQSLGPGGLTVRVTGETGRTYRIQLSTDLVDWSQIGTVSISTGTTADFIDTAQPTRGVKAFYRAVVP